MEFETIPMKVLLALEYPTLNGGERSLLTVLPELIRRKIRFQALAPARGELAKQLQNLDIRVTDFEAPHSVLDRRAWRVKTLTKAIADFQPDVIHANSLSLGRVVGHVTSSSKVPTVSHIRDMLGVSRAAIRDLNQNEKLIAVSHATRNWFIESGIEPERIVVLHNAVDFETFRPRPATGSLHRELQIEATCPLVLSVGQLGMRKGLDTLLLAFEQSRPVDSDSHLIVVGERNSQKQEAIEFVQSLHRLANRGPLAGRVHFLGRRTDVALLLNEAKLLVHLARQEPLGRVLLEAAASGCCVLATDVGGTREIFPTDAKSAILVRPDDPAAAGEQISSLLADPPHRQALANRAQSYVARNFTIERNVDGLFQIYREASR